MSWITLDEYLFAKIDRMFKPTTPQPRRTVIFNGLLRQVSPRHPAPRAMRMRERPGVRRTLCPRWAKKCRDTRRKVSVLRVRLNRVC
jgi:hypothetical protein